MKLVSFSVYGDAPMYLNGIIRNAQLMKKIYPGWDMRIYCEKTFPQQKRLKRLGAQVVVMKRSRGHAGMLWRFLPAWELGLERVIFRDADSRLNYREAAAVKEWEVSGWDAHAMHDHDHHRCYPLFGGMWGVKGGVLSAHVLGRIQHQIKLKRLKRVDDMKFLELHVFPEIKNSTLRHSSVKTKWESLSFPPHEEWDGFVGAKIE